ncbi:RNA polymerase sigma factor [Embleya sp. NPDC127516]|uniref:RNA polymerase sigma factor n=1 Tax=Embleya sp. NPDC127516 TaxID=3363990 RepID=UPI003803CCFC
MSESPERLDDPYDPTDAEMAELGISAIEVLDAFEDFDPDCLLTTFHPADPERSSGAPSAADAAEEESDGIDLTQVLPDDFVVFLHDHMHRLTRFALGYLDSRKDAEQTVSDVMLEVSQHWEELPEQAHQLAFRLLLGRLDDQAGRRARARRAVAPHRPEPERPEIRAALPWTDAFVEFAGAYRPALIRHARRRLGALHQDAEDVVPEVMLAMYMRWDLITEHRSPPQALAYRIVRGKAVDWQRRRRHTREISVDFTSAHAPDGPAAATHDDPGRFVPERDPLARAFALLPLKRGACAWLHLVMQVPLCDIADYLGVTISTVRSHLHLARRDLAATLRETLPVDPVRPHPPQGKNI